MTSALLVMDVQVGIVDRYADDAGLIGRLRRAIDAARRASVRVIYVVVGFRDDYAEVSPNNRSFSAIAQTGAYTDGDDNRRVHPDIAPQPGDIVVTKKRVSAFAGSDLDMVLRAQQINHLVISGISTSGVVLSTVRQAADLDFRLSVLSDGCADGDAEVHRVLIEKVFARQSEVVTIDQWIDSLRLEA
ncbi:MAG TPA: isochorismatase family cysteine hydrolase [Acidimicrobiales bacterium]|nr:isochorismatase family cysteine hydrolase [Acidimicrobiales bacterium]